MIWLGWVRMLDRSSIKLKILESGLFDESWYLSQYPDANISNLKPVDHFIICGLRENRNPGPTFDCANYLYLYKDVRESGFNPLLHYINTGREEGRVPSQQKLEDEIAQSGLFDPIWYKSKYPDVEMSGIDPLSHFVRFGRMLKRRPGPKFDANFYLESYPDVAATGRDPLLHYIRQGLKEGRRASREGSERVMAVRSWKGGGGENDAPAFVASNGTWIWRPATDQFMRRGLRPLAPAAVLINAPDAAAWQNGLVALEAYTGTHSIDLFFQGCSDFDFSNVPHAVASITYLGPADRLGEAAGFVSVAASGALDEYEGLLWLSPSEAGGDVSPVLKASPKDTDEFCKDAIWALTAERFIALKERDHTALFKALRIVLPRLGLEARDQSILVPSDPAVWVKPLLLRGLGIAIRSGEATTGSSQTSFSDRLTVLATLVLLSHKAGMSVRPLHEKVIPAAPIAERRIKAVAFYLPQYHPIPENDKWWGKGFTEWSNVTRGRPLFRHHDQPRQPADLGYYDLRLEATQMAQADLARQFGIHGFCYYYYWFNGSKLLNQPIEQMARSTQIDTGFCVCWANENWSRNWDGQNRHVLMKQEYSLESNRDLILELIPMMQDPRWIRYNGKPVMMVYRISIIPNWEETARIWREECRKAGLGEIHLCAVRFGLEALEGQPEEHGLDSYVLFPPHETARKDLRNTVLDLHEGFNGEIFDYDTVVDKDIEKYGAGYPWPVHRGAMLGWDNTARRLLDARIFHGATPYGFRRWIAAILDQEARFNAGSESMLFINAWNEWAEGTYLEPDHRWGKSYLSAFSSAAKASGLGATLVIPRGVAATPMGRDRLENAGWPSGADKKVPKAAVHHAGQVARDASRPTILVCAHSAGHQLFGGERSLLDVIDALAQMNVNVVVALPSGHNRPYVAALLERCVGVEVFPYKQWMNNRAAQGWVVTTFADIIARHSVDVVHVNTIVLLEPLVAAERMGCVRVVHARELISLDTPLQKAMGLSTEEIVPAVLGNSDWLIGNSRATCDLFARGKRTLYVPNAVEPQDFDLTNKFGETIKFGMVSSNLPKKGVADFVEVASRAALQVPAARFVVVGPITEQIKVWMEEVERGERPPNIDFVGYREHPRLAMSELNVLLNLSNFAESFGRTVAEGMASRRPVIAYSWGALPELVQHGQTGFLVPYRDIDAVVQAVKTICETPALIAKMGDNGRDFISENFAQTNLMSALADGYEHILGKVHDIGLSYQRVGEPSRTTVIVPVYNAAEEVQCCLTSVIKHTDLKMNRIIVIDDGSTDPSIKALLAQFLGIPGVSILTNRQNIGYTKTVNRGLVEAGQDDVVLLNSDTIVTPRWLEGLRSAAYGQEKVATVTAMSDNAGAFSFPRFNEACPKPEHLSHDEYAILVTQATRACIPPIVPTGSGFCMYIRRAFMEEHGIFDEEAFPRGYGEENDLCMRAVYAGWINLITPWSFVYHSRTASFKGEKEVLVKAGLDVVKKRYPDYVKQVEEAFSAPAMEALRRAVSQEGNAKAAVSRP